MRTSTIVRPADIRAGDKGAVARALNLIENRREDAQAAIEDLLSALRAGRGPQPTGHRVGLTGPPGVGKSTLTAAIVRLLRGRGVRVGVVAVDPSSVRSGGALLGDRARMGFDPADTGLFVRSLSTAGDPGGLTRAAPAAVEVLAAAFEVVLLETTGVGQTETEVEHAVDTVCLVIQPGSGDVLQFIKAGIMEIPDVLVVNKADQGAVADRTASDLSGALDTLRGVGIGGQQGWRAPVCLVSARDSEGIAGLVDALAAHREALADTGLRSRRDAGAVAWALGLFRHKHGEHGVALLGGPDLLRVRVAEGLAAGRSAPAVARQLSEAFVRKVRGD